MDFNEALNNQLEIREYLHRKDIGYVASFDPSDTEFIKKQQFLVNVGVLDVKYFFNQFERFWNDQTTPNFEPRKVGKSGNKLVNEGLTALAEMQVGARSKTFGVYAIGEGAQAVSPRDDALYDEVARLDIKGNGGTIRNRGSTVYYSLFFPKTIADFDVKETAILDSLSESDDTMLLRTVLPTAEIIEHDKDFDDIFVGHIIYSGSV